MKTVILNVAEIVGYKTKEFCGLSQKYYKKDTAVR